MMRFDLRLSQISFSISKQKQNVTKNCLQYYYTLKYHNWNYLSFRKTHEQR